MEKIERRDREAEQREGAFFLWCLMEVTELSQWLLNGDFGLVTWEYG